MGDNSELDKLEIEKLKKRRLTVVLVIIMVLIIGVIGIIMLQSTEEENIGMIVENQPNEKFTKYGERQRGEIVKTLCDTIDNHNHAATNNSKKVMLKEGVAEENTKSPSTEEELYYTTTEYIQDIKNNRIKPDITYEITFGYDPTTGYVSTIGIQEERTR